MDAQPQRRFPVSGRHARRAAILLALLSCHYDRTTGPPTGGPVAAVVVTTPRQVLAPGDTLRLTAQVLDSNAHVLPTEPVTWSSSTPAVARVDAQGVVTADSVGATTITATAAGQHGSTDLAVQMSVLCDCTEIIDSMAVTLVSRDDSTGLYVFRVIRGPPPRADSGTILVGAEDGGYIRRVLHRALVGDRLTVETAPAYVEEAVRDGDFSATVFSDSESGTPQAGQTWFGPWTTTYVAPGVGLTSSGRCCSLNGLGFSIKIAGETPPISGTLDFTVKQGDVVFSPRIDIGGHIGFFTLKDFHVGARGDLGLNLDLYELKVSLGAGKTIAPEKLKRESKTFIIQQRPFATFIGPMPLVGIITKKIELQITPTIQASAVFDGTFRTGLSVQAGVRWSKAHGWSPISGASSYFDATAPEFQGIEGSAGVKIAVVPELSVQFYGVVGPFVNLEPYAQATASADATFVAGTPSGLDWATRISLGLNLNMGAKLSLLGRKDLVEVGFAIPLIDPRELIRDFSDGPLTVRTASTGQDIPASYAVRLRPAFQDTLPLTGIRDLSTSHRTVSIASTDGAGVVLDHIRSGTGFPHQVTLDSVPGNCYVSNANPDTVAIASGLFIDLGHPATDTLFAVNCIPLGHLRVRAVTQGPDAAPRFAVTLQRQDTVGRPGKADAPLAISVPGGPTPPDTVIDDLIPVNQRRGANGRLSATLVPGRRNCAVARPDTNLVVIQSGDTVETQFFITCVPLGHIRLVTRTLDPDPAPISDMIRYAPQVSPVAAVDTVPVQPDAMLADDTARADSLVPLYNASGAPGGYGVALAGAPNRCLDSGGFMRAVTVLPGDTAITDFTVHCVERLQVVTHTTGPGIDPDGYAVVVENTDGSGTADTVPAGVTDTLGIAGVSPGPHRIALTGVDPTCVTPPPVDRTVSGSDSTLVTLAVTCPAPAPPADLHTTLVDSTRVDLAWTAPVGSIVASYRIYRNSVLHDSTANPSFSDTGLTPFTTFSYRVTAVDPNGLEGVPSAPLAVRTRDASPPTVPTALTATAVSASRVTLAWQPASDPETGVAGYVVYRDDVEVGRPTATAFSDTGLVAVTAYSYEVSALNGDGLEGSRSTPATTTTLDGTPPTAPPALEATPLSTTSIALTWSPAADAESGVHAYNVYRDGALAGTATTTAFTDVGLAPNTAYTYTVTAVNGAGLEGPASPAATASTLADQTPPDAPSGFTALATSTTRIALQWNAVSDAESGIRTYRIYREGVLVDSSATTSYADTGLAPGTTYAYEVSAVNGAGLESARSDPASATTPSDQDGDLVVHTATSGTGIPSGYTVRVHEGDVDVTQPIEPTGIAVFNRLSPQKYHVSLESVTGTCSVQDGTTHDVTVIAGTTVQTTFLITCQ
jgi:fibronectin type 3 domain-containing protein